MHCAPAGREREPTSNGYPLSCRTALASAWALECLSARMSVAEAVTCSRVSALGVKTACCEEGHGHSRVGRSGTAARARCSPAGGAWAPDACPAIGARRCRSSPARPSSYRGRSGPCCPRSSCPPGYRHAPTYRQESPPRAPDGPACGRSRHGRASAASTAACERHAGASSGARPLTDPKIVTGEEAGVALFVPPPVPPSARYVSTAAIERSLPPPGG